MKKLLLLLLIMPVISRAQVEKELILNTITIDSTKLDLVSFSYYIDGIDLATHEGIIATDLRRKKYETEDFFDAGQSLYVTYLRLLDKKQIKRLKSEIKEVKKFKDISFKKYFNVGVDTTDTPIQITYNEYGDYKFRILTLEDGSVSIPFDLGSSIKYGRYFGGNYEIADYIDYFNRPFYLETDLDGMERFIKFLQNK